MGANLMFVPEFPLFHYLSHELLSMLDGATVYAHRESRNPMRPGIVVQLQGSSVHGPQESVELPTPFPAVLAHGGDGPDPGRVRRPGPDHQSRVVSSSR